MSIFSTYTSKQCQTVLFGNSLRPVYILMILTFI